MNRSLIHRVFPASALSGLLAICFVLSAFNSDNDGSEYKVKAMFIYNFTKYVEWPANTQGTSFRIGIVGKSEITSSLEDIAKQKKVGEKNIEVRSFSSDDNNSYQIIFVSKSQSKEVEKIAKAFYNKGVLIITDETEGFDKGAAINLFAQDNKIRFEINQTQAKNGGVKISSQLFPLAIAVHQ